MRARHGADAVEGVLDVGHPVAERLVHGVLEGLRAGLHRHHLGAEHVHPKDVRLLPLDVDGAHVDDAVEAEARAERRGRDAVLAGAGLGDDPPLAHPAGEQNLAQNVVHLVGAGVVELVALEVDLGAAGEARGRRGLAQVLGQPLGEVERARPADIMREVALNLGPEGRVGPGLRVGLLELQDERHQGLGDEAAAEQAEMPALVGAGAEGVRILDDAHAKAAFCSAA
jgi:hypothetical protein